MQLSSFQDARPKTPKLRSYDFWHVPLGHASREAEDESRQACRKILKKEAKAEKQKLTAG